MPTPVTHLALAERLLREDALSASARHFLSDHRGPFLLGHTAADVQTISGQKRSETHFYYLPHGPEPSEKPATPAYQVLLALHPALADPQALSPAHAAFIAGYLAHILVDELWLHAIFLPYFRHGDEPWPERSFRHNVLRTWLDRRDHMRLNGTVAATLRDAEPHEWLPFVGDDALRSWRDWLVEQLGPGKHLQTAEVFAQRMGRSADEIETVLQAPGGLDVCVFGHIPRDTVRDYRARAHEGSLALTESYISRVAAR